MIREVGKAVVLARGLGTRMREADAHAALDARQAAAADAGLKAMIPVGRPFLDYALSALADSGISEACLVIGPEHGAVRERYSRLSPRRIRVSFAVQERPLGTADAVAAAEAFAAGEEFLALNGDDLYPVSALRALRALRGPGVALFSRAALVSKGNVPAERVARFAVATVGGDGFLGRLYEKPDEATLASLGSGALFSMNCWRFPPAIFEACRRISPSGRGELELPDAVELAMRELGARFEVVRCEEGILDLSNRADVVEVAERLSAIEPDL